MFLKCLNVCENVKILSICYVVKINNFNVLLYFYIKYYFIKSILVLIIIDVMIFSEQVGKFSRHNSAKSKGSGR